MCSSCDSKAVVTALEVREGGKKYKTEAIPGQKYLWIEIQMLGGKSETLKTFRCVMMLTRTDHDRAETGERSRCMCNSSRMLSMALFNFKRNINYNRFPEDESRVR